MAEQSGNMKMRVARALKWNLVDKVATQILYAVTGIILARVLSEADFGLIGAILVFQAFASMFVDSGFSYALIQRKIPPTVITAQSCGLTSAWHPCFMCCSSSALRSSPTASRATPV